MDTGTSVNSDSLIFDSLCLTIRFARSVRMQRSKSKQQDAF
jgi:hypothetical protein